MRLATFSDDDERPRLGVQQERLIVDLAALTAHEGAALPGDLLSFIGSGPKALDAARSLLEGVRPTHCEGSPVLATK